ncbi:GNAT family N-acetyltransferase [Pseudanabaena sp. PCC 6802]|uniref:GNAT family N-acetyltransferase n=1 Tax=Pseudanabaena sp. PCC 6802 TaxID=118173 RepID=UPI00056A326D|nr:GNAT family N-acetyltransferase [Pseudanabaena sp. PCC 6802]
MNISPVQSLTDSQVEQLHELYQHEWWSCGRNLADVRKMLSNSDFIFGICEERDRQLVAFARVLSDRVYRALIFDVIVAEDYRGKGLGLLLIEQIVSHPELSQVECIQLFCLPEMLPFYQKMGFDLAEQILLVRQRSISLFNA